MCYNSRAFYEKQTAGWVNIFHFVTRKVTPKILQTFLVYMVRTQEWYLQESLVVKEAEYFGNKTRNHYLVKYNRPG